ncbi:DUF2612 domain-containing protein [Bombella apis]|uniref:DUF2612 domain-containing protein n=1 Tax=Bombella apis TaxID=1785988 RepID=UPI0012B9A326|nr:DUF2612 domain-containing protein [Bombella apis]MPV99252.1 DUF2612 domain-containing protein [Bombella apis]
MIDIRETILAQYANSRALTGILERFNAAVDPQRSIEPFLHDVWNPATAKGWGLDVWGRIVGVGRVLRIDTTGYWGFAQGYPTSRTFGEGIWYSGRGATANYRLTDENYRQLILAKAAANISAGSIADINRILMILFGNRGNCYLADTNDHTMMLVFSFRPTAIDVSIIASGVLPRPSGVQYRYTFIPPAKNDFGNDIL